MKQIKRALSLTGLLLALSAPAFAQVAPVPPLMNFQARLAKPDGTPLPDGTYTVTLSLWDVPSGGSVLTDQLWTETETVTVHNGLFAALLGNTTALTDSLFNKSVYLEIQVGTDAALAPRQQLVTVAHAFKADTVPDGSITGVKIAPGTITADKLAAGVGGGFTLPFAASAASSDAPLFDLTNTDAGGAARFSGASGNYSVYAKGGAYTGLSAETTAAGGNGVVGIANNGTGAYGVYGISSAGIGVVGSSVSGYAGYFNNKVQVNAGLAVTGASSPYPASIGSGVFIEGGGTTYAAVYGFNYANFTPVNLVLNTPGGNVGIGTLTPQATLDVNGNIIERGSDFMLRGRGGGVGNNGGLGRALVDFGASGLVLNFANDFGGVTIGSGVNILGGMTSHFVNIVGGSDVAEPYNVAAAGEVKAVPGMLVSIDANQVGQMRVSSRAYDPNVAGIISGANGIQPGITLRQTGTVADGALPVASIGRVYCWCDADANGPIEPGNMLTSSDTPGHAMKATDRERRDGAVIGKAMSALKSGKGLVLVLVSLK